MFSPDTTAGALERIPCHTLAPITRTQMAQIAAGYTLIKQWMNEKGYTE